MFEIYQFQIGDLIINKMEANPEFIKQQILQLHTNLTQKILPKSEEAYNSIKNLYQNDVKQYQSLIGESSKIVDGFRAKQEEYSINLNEILTKKTKDTQFTSKGQGYLNAKAQEIKNKTKNIDSVTAGIKETVGKIKPQKLAKLPADKQPILQRMFSTLYQVLYEEQNKKFEWPIFKEKALKYEDGQDFVFRLVNINFKDLNSQKVDMLAIMKGDPQFDNLCINSLYSYDIIDLADWMEYIVVGHQFAEDKKVCEKEYQKIRKDIDKRGKGSLEMSEKFWREAIEEIQRFQNNIQGFEAQLKGIVYGMNKSVQEIDDALIKRRNKIREINAM